MIILIYPPTLPSRFPIPPRALVNQSNPSMIGFSASSIASVNFAIIVATACSTPQTDAPIVLSTNSFKNPVI